MAKRVKTKKGSIGKKALAAILAASMVLSSSAFSVLAAEAVSDAEGDGAVAAAAEPVEVIDSEAGIAPASLNEENGIAVTALDPGHKIVLGFEKEDGTISNTPDKQVYDTYEKKPKVVVYDCKHDHNTANQCAGSDCTRLDNTNKKLYEVEWKNSVNAGTGYNYDKIDGSNQGTLEDESKFAEAGPYVRVNFSNNQQSGAAGSGNPYADLGDYYISYKIDPVNLDDVDVAITQLQYGWTYTGKDIYPGMSGISVTLGGKKVDLVEGRDYIAEAAPGGVHDGDSRTFDDDLRSASELNASGSATDPKDDKRVILKGIDGLTLPGESEARKGNFTGTLGDEHYNGDKTTDLSAEKYCNGTCSGKSNKNYPSYQLKDNDHEIVYHINQRTNSGDIQIDDNIVIIRKVGETNGATREDFIKILNGNVGDTDEAGATAKVYDSRRAATDPQYYMTCDNYTDNDTEDDNSAVADYEILFEQPDKTWGDEPDASTGTHRFKITTTGRKDYVKGSSVIGNYTVQNPSRLQKAIEDHFKITYKTDKTIDGMVTTANASVPYDGTDHYPSKWNKNTIEIGSGNTALVYGIDYKVSSEKEEWKKADTYTLKLQGLGGIPDETAEIKVTITPRNINELLTSTYQKEDADQGFDEKDGTAGNNGNQVGTTSDYNLENTRIADKNNTVYHNDKNEKQQSAVRVLAEQGKHTTSENRTETVVEITDAGLDASVGDNGKVTLEKDVDYRVVEKERTTGGKKVKYVEIKGIGNYTTKITKSGKDVVTVYEEDIDLLDKMPLNSDSITAYVDPASYEIKQKGQKIQLTTSNIKMTENDNGTPKTLTSSHFNIVGYEQNGKFYDSVEGITKPGKAYVIVGPTLTGGYINQKKIPFTVTGADFNSEISIDAIPEYELGTGTDIISDILDGAIVARYADDPTHPTFSKSEYDVTVKDPDGEIVAVRRAKDQKWYVSSSDGDAEDGYKEMSAENSNQYKVKLGTYKVIVEATDYRFEGTAETDFAVIGQNIATIKGLTVTYQNAWDYTGKEITPPVTVKLADGTILVEDVDYTVTYSHNVDVGLGLIVLKGTGAYSGTIDKTFNIGGIAGTIDVEASQKTALANGVAAGGKDTLNVVAYVGGKQVAENVDYTLTSDTPSVVEISADGRTMNYKAAGSARITVTPKGGNVEADPIIITVNVTEKADPTIKTPTFTPSRLKKVKKSFTVTTCKVPGATEWEVKYSLKSSMKSSKTKAFDSNRTDRLYRQAVTCNKSGKTYYIQVRAYVNGKWSAWSPKKSIKSR